MTFNTITLITDFGDYYPGVVKCAIKSCLKCLKHEATIIDISHEVEPFNVYHGAFLLFNSWKYIKAVHCAVVDPTVGSERKAIVVVCKNSIFVGPDNGILYPAAKEAEIVKILEVKDNVFDFLKECIRTHTNKNVTLSTTFHGRDIFAPASAIASAGKIEKFGCEIEEDEITKIDLFNFKVKNDKVKCRIVFNDRFGNAITNLKSEVLQDVVGIEVKGIYFPMVNRITDVDIKEPFAIIGSFSTLELCIREGSAKDAGLKTGEIKIKLVR